jgi:hypothetical protein
VIIQFTLYAAGTNELFTLINSSKTFSSVVVACCKGFSSFSDMANKDLRLKKIVLDSNRLCNFLYPSCVLFIQTEVVLLYCVSLCLIPLKHNLQMSDRVCAKIHRQLPALFP